MKEKYNWRAEKRYTAKLAKNLQKLRYFEDCNYHVAKVTRVFIDPTYKGATGDVDGISLFTGKGTGCSLRHCNPVPLTEKEAMERVAYFKAHGFDEYQRKYIYQPMSDEEWANALKEIQEFRRVWRDGAI